MTARDWADVAEVLVMDNLSRSTGDWEAAHSQLHEAWAVPLSAAEYKASMAPAPAASHRAMMDLIGEGPAQPPDG